VKTKVDRQTIDLSGFPDLVVIYLGMRVRTLPGLRTLVGLGPQIDKAGAGRPDGLLHFENNIIFSLFPLHLGMRWYWRDYESMERWTRSEPHRLWWQRYIRDSGGTGFWHETYRLKGGMEAVYADMTRPVGLLAVAPAAAARGTAYSARRRLGLAGEELAPPVGMAEREIY
jgi:hypothetical protein